MTTPQERLYKVAENRITAEQRRNPPGRPRNDSARKRLRLPAGFQPGPLDVICAKGSMAYSHSGNRWFRHFVEQQLPKYVAAASRLEKSAVVTETLMSVRTASPHGGFVRSIDGQYYEIGDIKAREKISQAFRDLLHTEYRSSTKAKSMRRKSLETTSTQETAATTGTDSSHTGSTAADTPTNHSAPRGGGGGNVGGNNHNAAFRPSPYMGGGGMPACGMMPMNVFIAHPHQGQAQGQMGMMPKPYMARSGPVDPPAQQQQGLWPMLGMDTMSTTSPGDFSGDDDDDDDDDDDALSMGSFMKDLGDLDPLPLEGGGDNRVAENLSVVESDIDSFFEKDL